MSPGNISIQDYTYDLPVEKIAMHPLPERDASKLLVYKEQRITESTFNNLASFIKPGSLLVYNNTRVLNARLIFYKDSGKKIEIFCLEPLGELTNYDKVMSKTEKTRWKCLVGGASSWKSGTLIKKIKYQDDDIILEARLIEKVDEAFVVEFNWSTSLTFGEVLLHVGDVPLPPYIKRKPVTSDDERYQTIYSSKEGSVAAPTAGLHFTDAVFDSLHKKKIERLAVTLHVSAGTFKPVTAGLMHEHIMHAEWIDVDIASIEKLATFQQDVVAVGTTSLRTLETLYWLGVKALQEPDSDTIALSQWDAYQLAAEQLSGSTSLQALLNWMTRKKFSRLITTTQLLIVPGYTFKMAHAIITNFHQPQSTLLLLVAAAVGETWKKMYQHALANDFRFLSYGDSNLIYIDQGLMVTDVPTGI